MYIVCSLVGGSGWAKARSKPVGSWSEKEKKERMKLQLHRLNNEANEEEEEVKADLWEEDDDEKRKYEKFDFENFSLGLVILGNKEWRLYHMTNHL